MLMEEPVMKKCQSCSSQATFHFTDIVNGHKNEVHLCQNCAEEKQAGAVDLPGVWDKVYGVSGGRAAGLPA